MNVQSRIADRHLRFVIIGAGMAGLLSGLKLKERGDEEFVIYEKGDKVGGTWRENHYPGLSCDTPAHSYTYSFALNPDWSKYFAPGPEIREYFEMITDRYGLRDKIVFNTMIASCDFVNGRWHIETSDGRKDVADVVIAATGVLHHPSIPDIPGLADFKGALFPQRPLGRLCAARRQTHWRDRRRLHRCPDCLRTGGPGTRSSISCARHNGSCPPTTSLILGTKTGVP